MHHYHLEDLLPPDVLGKHAKTQVHVPEWVFKPDHWTATFLRGLIEASKGFESARLWEVGVGTGINLIALSDRVPNAKWYFSDYNPACVKLALSNLKAANIDCGRYNPLLGKRNLVYSEDNQAVPTVDVIFGCLPQVPTTKDLREGDRVAHYYDPAMFPRSTRHACGLALNESLLLGAKKVLPQKGKVILNLSGRPGKKRLQNLFSECGYDSRVLYEAIVPQHAATSLETLSKIESKAGSKEAFEFFADPDGQYVLSARCAEERRVNGLSVYHKIFVIEGVLQ